eukprot:CAMPEP_0203744086 /NCGR_PEP_ID=MMETSP0098-20131031/282_1 /ASSEMBLY_ACC=CAM_ASM_000208 /TAXON_ID=96639 /ORGANISM=" , Strain NY0313808BC1" /LENGTH=257 /DNA_ID=CAMNT_0050631519 /DNA_START=541 /DNA_END=1311 /DNA_ORIENTATION=-
MVPTRRSHRLARREEDAPVRRRSRRGVNAVLGASEDQDHEEEGVFVSEAQVVSGMDDCFVRYQRPVECRKRRFRNEFDYEQRGGRPWKLLDGRVRQLVGEFIGVTLVETTYDMWGYLCLGLPFFHMSVQVSEETFPQVVAMLQLNSPSLKGLTLLIDDVESIPEHGFVERLCRAFARNSELVILSMKGFGLLATQIATVVASLELNYKLRTLLLNDNAIGKDGRDGVKILCRFVATHPLQNVSISSSFLSILIAMSW